MPSNLQDAFQTFDPTTSPEQGPPRLADLRAAMARAGVAAFLVPRADAHQGEYVAPADERLAWLTGFTGSAGIAAITRDAAGIFVDGRYTVQVSRQVADEFSPVSFPATKPADWLAEELNAGDVVGFDPWLHTVSEIEAMHGAFERRTVTLRPVDNFVDEIWADRPPPPAGRVSTYPEALAGTSAAEKRARIAADLREAGAAWAVLTLPDSIAWLLNIRGSDIPRTPVLHAFALVEARDGAVRLFVDAAKIEEGVLPDDVAVLPPGGFLAALSELAGPVRVDPASAPWIVADTIEAAGIQIQRGADPCVLPKAAKTPAEIAATAEAHLRDGAAIARFLHWLDGQAEAVRNGTRVTEIDVVRRLERLRRDTNALRDISFETIAGSGPHGAIVHYRVTTETDRALVAGELLLVDSGGQYEDGTTDITRTIPIGPPDPAHVTAFTQVLRGMIAISRARFPRGVAGRDIDALARQHLWAAGRDFDHGTGHGVGVYLSVHEGPQRISRRSEVPLEPGMILSNEPGHYREGEWGIRIENLVVVDEPAPPEGADPGRDLLGFRTLTFAPIDRRLVDVAALAQDEADWLDAYHAETVARIGPRVDDVTLEWLRAACAPLR